MVSTASFVEGQLNNGGQCFDFPTCCKFFKISDLKLITDFLFFYTNKQTNSKQCPCIISFNNDAVKIKMTDCPATRHVPWGLGYGTSVVGMASLLKPIETVLQGWQSVSLMGRCCGVLTDSVLLCS